MDSCWTRDCSPDALDSATKIITLDCYDAAQISAKLYSSYRPAFLPISNMYSITDLSINDSPSAYLCSTIRWSLIECFIYQHCFWCDYRQGGSFMDVIGPSPHR